MVELAAAGAVWVGMQSIMRRTIFVSWASFAALTVITPGLTLPPVNAQAALSQEEAHRLLRKGGVALLLRHGQTESGIGDPPGFTLDTCSTQRNLSVAGRAELRDMASRLSGARVSFARTLTSQWCRCRETAQLLTGAPAKVEDWGPLNSQFSGNAVVDSANAQVVAKIRQISAKESWLLVTHQVNITAMTGVSPVMGEGVLVQPSSSGFRVLGRVKL